MKEEFRILTDREHVLKRPGMYVGSTRYVEASGFLWDGNKMKKTNYRYVPALIKIIDEIIDNSIDEAIRTKFKKCDEIKIEIKKHEVSVQDNGRGIPVKKVDGTDEWIPVLAWTRAKAGSNFEDEKRETIGANGVGSFATNVLSKKFIGESCDGKKKLILKCENNLERMDYEIADGRESGVKVTFYPDFSLFENITEIDEIHQSIVKSRIINLSVCYPSIKFWFNGEKINPKNFKEHCLKFATDFEVLESENLKVAIFSSETDEFSFVNYINGINLIDGGNPLNWLIGEIAEAIKTKLEKKFKNIKIADIKSKLSLIAYFFGFENLKFDSQSKTKCINSHSEFKHLVADVDFDSFASRICKNEAIITPIIEYHKIKEEFKNRKELSLINKKKTNKIEKFFPSVGENRYLVLTEGDSAASGIMQALGRKEYAYFPLKGKPLNCYEAAPSKIAENEEIKNIASILNLDLTKEEQEIDFENVLLATDNDFDGTSIKGLLIAFFARFGKDLLRKKKIKILKTPLITAFKDGKIAKWFFDLNEYREFAKNEDAKKYSFKYYKGLGSWEKEELKEVFEKGGLSNFFEDLEFTDDMMGVVKKWMAKEETDERKKFLKGMNFDINFI